MPVQQPPPLGLFPKQQMPVQQPSPLGLFPKQQMPVQQPQPLGLFPLAQQPYKTSYDQSSFSFPSNNSSFFNKLDTTIMTTQQ